MEKALILAGIIGPFYLVYGLSLLLYVKQWQKLVTEFSKNHFIWLPFAFFGFIIGLVMVNVYNVWAWDLYIVITLTGWCLILKSVFYFLAPENLIKATMKCKCIKSDAYFYFFGSLLTVLGVLLSYNAYLA